MNLRAFLFLLALSAGTSSQAYAGEWRLGLHQYLSSEHKLKSTDATYENQGWGLGVDYLFSRADGMSSTYSFVMGLGLAYSGMSAKRKNMNTTWVLSPREFDFETFQARFFPGFAYGILHLEFPLGLAALRETSGFNKGDEKYGFSYGIQLHLGFFNNRLQLGAAYEQIHFPNGKNSATGEKGSLSKPWEMSNTRFMLAYVHSFAAY